MLTRWARLRPRRSSFQTTSTSSFNVGLRRRPRNKLGFALQLCVLRYPGRLLAPGEFVPPAVVDFIGRQLHLDGEELGDYAVRAETRHEHLAELRRLYGFRSFSGGAARELVEGLHEEAPQAQSNEDLVRRFVEACRRTRTILPATTTIERLCADALVDAERRIEARIAERVPPGLRRDLEHLLEETVDAGVTRFVWLRQFEPGSNSADANRLLDRLEHLRRLAVPEGLFGDIPPHRITRLRRQGERYFADGLRELPDNRRLAILGVCAVEWETFVADAVVETHDRIVGRTYREAARTCESQLGDETAAVREALRAFAELGRALIGARDTGEALDGRGPRGAAAFAELGRALIGARDTGEALDAVIADRPGWGGLGDLVARAAALANTNSKWSRRLGSPPLGDGGAVPPARRLPRRRRLAGAVAPLRRYPEDAAGDSRRPGCRPQPAGPGPSARLARRAPARRRRRPVAGRHGHADAAPRRGGGRTCSGPTLRGAGRSGSCWSAWWWIRAAIGGRRRADRCEHWKAGSFAAYPGVRRETVRAVVEHESGRPGSAVEVQRLAQRVRLASGAVGRQVVIL